MLDALTFQAGYNAALVAVGAALLGIAAGVSGSFLVLRKRALVSDAVAHATLPGICLAFMVMVALGGDGRNLAGLLVGSALSAALGLAFVSAMTRHTRLPEDTGIGAILSVFFGLGVVLLTVIQSIPSGQQAGLEDFLLGSTAGMLFADAALVALGGALAVAVTALFHRPLSLVAFDPEFAVASGISVRRADALTMGLVLAVTVVGLKFVGLILIVALLIIPPVTARFWSDRTDRLLILSGLFGGASGYLGAAISASAPALPAGPIIVLVATALFAVSLLLSPQRGAVAAALSRRRFERAVHRRQGLLSLSREEPIHDRMTLSVLRAGGLIRRDGVPTDKGRAIAAKAARDERRWDAAERLDPSGPARRTMRLVPVESVFTADEIAALDASIGGPKVP